MDTDISLDLSRLEDLCLSVIKSICIGKSTTTLSIFDELIEQIQTTFDNHFGFCYNSLKNRSIDISMNVYMCMSPIVKDLYDLLKYTLIISKFLIPVYLGLPEIEEQHDDEDSITDYVKWCIVKDVKEMTFKNSIFHIKTILGKTITLESSGHELEISVYNVFPIEEIINGCLAAMRFEEFREENRKGIEKLDLIFGVKNRIHTD